MSGNFARQLVDTLAAQGVRRIFGLVGDSLNPVVDAVRQSDDIEWIHVHNEESAAFAAGAESLVTGDLAVCAASCGPGNTHLIQGLYDAHRNGAKVLAIASHIPSQMIGSSFFQETHPEQIFQECSGYCEMVNSAEQGAKILHNAIQSTMAGNGVSVLVMPGDLASEDAADMPTLKSTVTAARGVVKPEKSQVDDLARAINDAESVTFMVGAGAAGARDEVLELAARIKAPVGHALGGKEIIEYDNPFDVGMSGLLGYGGLQKAMDDADLFIMIGTDFPYSDFLPTANVAQIDADASHIGRRTTVTHPVHGDVGETIRAVLPLVTEKTDSSFLDKMLRHHERELTKVVEAYTHGVEDRTPIHPEFAARVLDELAADDAVFTVDTGMCNVWAARYVTPNGRRRVLGSWRHGTMANALPHAIGAQAADPTRQVISMSGDGGLAMLLGELLTVRRSGLPVKTIVFNNSSLGMVKLEMLVEGMPDYGTDHDDVDYAAVAAAMGMRSVRITDPKRLREQLADALAYDGPVLVDVVTDPDALSMPPEISLEQVAGFAKASVRTVLDGGVGKMIDMARANLRNVPRP
ncbi:pyruvate dehydrogenase [Corynebacterium xerosis]|uniref:Pyruvate dehydrogenase n=1 Tax=Corynebacterium xerosis TaxID=1725 RepID=A0A7X9SX69_9CORY|nr:pyruvate dehydrogenase [Corynebacterium xerosis]NMF09735.1 pyruvate dehydrogenase [Corynebacterium xerosis]SQB95982.1 IlvI [Clostridium paraputrificum]HJG57312.1 pyruvate dehydrogenase [Corynebacterium xerosis]